MPIRARLSSMLVTLAAAFKIPSIINSGTLKHLDENRLIEIAKAFPPQVTLRRYPGWRFGIAEETSADKETKLRFAIWKEFKNRRLEIPIIIPWHFNLRINAYLGNDVSRLLFIDGHYEPNEMYFLASVLKPGMTFLDLGANDGVFSLFAAHCVGAAGKVYAFEPSLREYSRLVANIELNNLTQVVPLQFALHKTTGYMNFQIAGYEHEGQNTLGDFIYQSVDVAKIQKVLIKRLDDVVTELGCTRIDVIKLDIEGAEHAALQGALETLQKFKPILLLEFSNDALSKQGSSTTMLEQFLLEHQYRLMAFDDRGDLQPTEAETANGLNIVALPPTPP